jgi:hypothetical protein
VLPDAAMKAIKASTVDYARKCDHEPDWWTKVGEKASIKRRVFDIFDQHNTHRLVNDLSASRFLDRSLTSLSPLEIALTPEICNIFKYLSSCLHDVGVVNHPAGGCAAAFGKSTAPFEHDRPDGLETMSESYVEEMRRRLHIRIVLSRMGCATYPHQDQISNDSCIVLLALHAGTGGVGQWKIALLDSSYLPGEESAHGEC